MRRPVVIYSLYKHIFIDFFVFLSKTYINHDSNQQFDPKSFKSFHSFSINNINMKFTVAITSIAVALALSSSAEAASCSSVYGQCGGKQSIHLVSMCPLMIYTHHFFPIKALAGLVLHVVMLDRPVKLKRITNIILNVFPIPRVPPQHHHVVPSMVNAVVHMIFFIYQASAFDIDSIFMI